MVAISGAIMPEPLQMPLMVTGTPSIFAVRVAAFTKVSVVMIAVAAAAQRSAWRSATTASRLLVIRSSGSGSPMTPVEATKISFAEAPSFAAVAFTVRSTEALPSLPVKALALPALMTIAARLAAPEIGAAAIHRC